MIGGICTLLPLLNLDTVATPPSELVTEGWSHVIGPGSLATDGICSAGLGGEFEIEKMGDLS